MRVDTVAADPPTVPVPIDQVVVRRPALSPSRAGDFKQCPLLYRFRAVDRIPETPSKAQVRGTVVHSVLEKLFGLPPEQRVPDRAGELVGPAWEELLAEQPDLAGLFEGTELADWLTGAQDLLAGYFELEDPTRLRPEACSPSWMRGRVISRR